MDVGYLVMAAPAKHSRRAERSYSTSKVRRGGSEEILLFQGKRNPSKTVGVVRGHQRADTLKPNHRQVVNLITWTTAVSNSMKLKPWHVGPPKMDGSWWRVLTKCGPLEKGMANHFSIFALRNP